MKYRLIRFSPNGEVELDAQCVTPNQFGCNRDWLKANPDCSAVLIERATRTPQGKDVDNIFYLINKRDVLTNKGNVYSTWIGVTESDVLSVFKYLEMLKLTGAL